jgi:subtilisin family serine protease
MIGQVSPNATLKQAFPSKGLAENRMKLLGTSFAAPVVAGMAANLLAKNPSWTPDKVKGALMVSAKDVSDATSANSLGVGEANLQAAFAVASPPNPNLALMRDSSGRNVFDTERWKDMAESSASWSSASWSSSSYSDNANDGGDGEG